MLFLLCLATFKTSSSLHLHCQGTFELMRTRSCIFSLTQVPRCSIHSLPKCREGEALCNFIKIYGNKSSIRLYGSRIYGPERGFTTKWIKRCVTKRAEESKQTTWDTKSRSTKHESFREEILPNATVNENTTQLDQFQKIQWPEVQEIAQYKNLSDLLTVIVFDVETTGYSRVNDRIIDIALRDLQGGEHSTFQTLVNPQCHVPNSHVHGIATHMVNRTDVPRMEDLVPILLQYIRSREKHDGYVLWVAHNARAFDAPFLMHEFIRCSMEIPHNWLFLDTLPLARQLIKSGGTNLSSASLAALREFYRVEVDGLAHRAMVDVNTLSQVLPVLTSDLKLTLSSLVKKSFSFSDLMIRAKKR
ncbi:exonuclease DPD1, chloroplastic/mitochondrial-like [Vigna umbellata]|uniref:exonuclease DPD1, chloroplastic/mitochondrial-like n=1 Tax=Vigna umbellata TaxID=87088 RepID=UPI001F5E6F06|nr:exonuclease DPD1, chloroplastic/mitochondrial-like [Vigna umbellata]